MNALLLGIALTILAASLLLIAITHASLQRLEQEQDADPDADEPEHQEAA